MAEFIASVEEAFGIDIPDDDFDGLATVGDLIAYVKRRRA
jgi:acyl carrier protein